MKKRGMVLSSAKMIFNVDEAERLRTKIGRVSQDTNQLYLQFKGKASDWNGIPLGQELLHAQVLINELTSEAEKLEDLIRSAVQGFQGVQAENKRQGDQLSQQLGTLAGLFGSLGGSGSFAPHSIPALAQKAVTGLIRTVSILSGRDEMGSDPVVQKLRGMIQQSGLASINGLAAQLKLKEIYEARELIGKSQTAYGVYKAFGNQAQMEAAHQQAEEARKKLKSMGISEIQYQPGKDLRGYYKQPAIKACDYDPSIKEDSVPVLHNEEYLLLLRMGMEENTAGAYARSQLEAKRLEIEAAEGQRALDNRTGAKKYNFEEYSKTLVGSTWVLQKNGITNQDAAQASIAYQEAIKSGEIRPDQGNVPVDIMQEQMLAAKDGINYWTGEKITKLQAYSIIFSSLVVSFQGIQGLRGNIKRTLPLHPGATEITASRVKKIKVPVFEGTGNPDHPIRTYRDADLSKLEAKYTADPRLTVEMPYVGKEKNSTNSEGWLRDKDYYWKEVMEKYPESISKANKQKIELGFSPINDKQFREHFPQFNIKELNNDTLIHHHIGGGGQAVAVPSKLHPGSGGIHNAEKEAGIWGSDSQYAELLEKFLNK
ncbi:hypothetical protein [Paenibacillus sp. MMS20-IR301]|uniref:hypothetical protein n=1 Tax=Paenibacillus sp. MMS20-IR301 TaxID=2895946 RepID=UPI0028EBDA4A|nr:hypothetical protein [Paenibacillus sp. MMS20-IR301]WNS43945.1 hypothetical protein LOS79_01375 [Paenibacillus sp. MMS20-IR301]